MADEGEEMESLGVGEREMDSTYYNHLEDFLSRPSPAVAGGAKKGAKKGAAKGLNRKDDSVLTHTQSRTQPSMSASSSLAPTKNGSKKTKAKSLKQSVASSGYGASSSYGAGRGGPARAIDTALLDEAFSYADKVAEEQRIEERWQQRALQQQQQHQQQQDVAEYSGGAGEAGYYFESEEPGQQWRQMAMEMQQRNPEVPDGARWAAEPVKRRVSGGSGTGPTTGPRSVYRGQKSLPSNKVNVVRSLKAKKDRKPSGASGSRSGGAFAVSAQSMDNSLSSKSNPTDFDALLRNFTEGTNLQKLRSELAESRASMERSKQFILDMANGK